MGSPSQREVKGAAPQAEPFAKNLLNENTGRWVSGAHSSEHPGLG